jgi:hypothetical protein
MTSEEKETFFESIKDKLTSLYDDKNSPESWLTKDEVVDQVLAGKGTPDSERPYLFRLLSQALMWAFKNDTDFHIWPDYVKEVRGWRIIKAVEERWQNRRILKFRQQKETAAEKERIAMQHLRKLKAGGGVGAV